MGEVGHCVAIVWSQPWLVWAKHSLALHDFTTRQHETLETFERQQREQAFANIQSMFPEKWQIQNILLNSTLYACPEKLF